MKNFNKIFILTFLLIIFGAVIFAQRAQAEDVPEIKQEKKVANFATMRIEKIQASLDSFRIDTHKKLVDKKADLVEKKANPAPEYQTKLAQIKYALLILLFTFLVYLFSTLMIFYIALGVAIFLVFSFIWRNLL